MKGKNKTFGKHLKALRLKAGFGLRRFANLIEIKASNLCDIEHDRRSMPKNYLEPVAEALGLVKNTADWQKFFELARKSDELPADIERIAQGRLMPALLRTIDNRQLSDDEIKKLIDDIQGGRNAKEKSC